MSQKKGKYRDKEMKVCLYESHFTVQRLLSSEDDDDDANGEDDRLLEYLSFENEAFFCVCVLLYFSLSMNFKFRVVKVTCPGKASPLDNNKKAIV